MTQGAQINRPIPTLLDDRFIENPQPIEELAAKLRANGVVRVRPATYTELLQQEESDQLFHGCYIAFFDGTTLLRGVDIQTNFDFTQGWVIIIEAAVAKHIYSVNVEPNLPLG